MKNLISALAESAWVISGISAISVFSVSAWALDANEYQSSLRALKRSQRSTDAKLMQLGVKLRPDSGLGNGGAGLFGELEKEKESEKAILVVHQDAQSIRAQAGKFLFGRTLNRLLVSGDDVPAVIELLNGQGVFSGLRALGRARMSGTEGRIAIQVDRIISRTGKAIPIKGTIQDEAGAYGLEAQVLSSKALAVVGAMAGSFISGLAASQQTMAPPTAFGFQQPQTSGRNAILQGVAQTAADQSKRLIDESTKERPILLAGEDTPVVLYLDEEVRF